MAKRKRRLLIVPFFLPNLGCPFRCVYCNQNAVTGTLAPPSSKQIQTVLEKSINREGFLDHERREIAFFGGTFTNLPKDTMEEVFQAVSPYLGTNGFHGLRISTRPDMIKGTMIKYLKDRGVEVIELGAQSLVDHVLTATKRGHLSKDVEASFYTIKEHGLKCGIQLMGGLPGESRNDFFLSLERLIDLSPDFVRLYATLVFKGTKLEEEYLQGRYRPLELEEAVDMFAHALLVLEQKGIPVIRIGLLEQPGLREEVVAGPYHPCFGHLVRSRAYIKSIAMEIRERHKGLMPEQCKGHFKIFVPGEKKGLFMGGQFSGPEQLIQELGCKDVLLSKGRSSWEVQIVW